MENKRKKTTILPIEDQTEAEDLVKLFEELDAEEKKGLLTFIQGIRFAKTMAQVV